MQSRGLPEAAAGNWHTCEVITWRMAPSEWVRMGAMEAGGLKAIDEASYEASSIAAAPPSLDIACRLHITQMRFVGD